MLDEILHSVSDVLNALPEQRTEERSIIDEAEGLAVQFNEDFDAMVSNSVDVELSYHYIQTVIRYRYSCNLDKLGIKEYHV